MNAKSNDNHWQNIYFCDNLLWTISYEIIFISKPNSILKNLKIFPQGFVVAIQRNVVCVCTNFLCGLFIGCLSDYHIRNTLYSVCVTYTYLILIQYINISHIISIWFPHWIWAFIIKYLKFRHYHWSSLLAVGFFTINSVFFVLLFRFFSFVFKMFNNIKNNHLQKSFYYTLQSKQNKYET